MSDELTQEAAGADVLARIWEAIFKLAKVKKAAPIKHLWVVQVGTDWTLASNGTKQPVKHNGYRIPPYHCAVWFGDWLAGSFSPYEGVICAGSLANAETLITAIKAECR